MGACNIEFTLNKKASRNEIQEAFKRQQKQDASQNGSHDGYTGDFQTVSKVDIRTDQIFMSYNEAHDFCLKNASKWETVVAVYFCDSKIESKQVARLQAQVKALASQLQGLAVTPLARSKAFQTCGACKSRLALKAFQGTGCPVCCQDLRPKGLQDRIARLDAKLEALQGKLDAKIKTEREKLAKNTSQIKTMVAGWGAC